MNTTREQMWAKQSISAADVDYRRWNNEKALLHTASQITSACLFAVDVYKGAYSYASEQFSDIFGYDSSLLKNIEKQGNYLEDRFHPDDRGKIIETQIKLSRFIYSLPAENRNDYRNIYQYRIKNSKGDYIHVMSRQEVMLADRNNKAWIVKGMVEVLPEQSAVNGIKCSVLNRKTGEIFTPSFLFDSDKRLTSKETEILCLIKQGLLSKEIAIRLNISINTVHNHRKNILSKLNVSNSIEAINLVDRFGI